MNNKGKGHLKYLLYQTEIFAHFGKGEHSASQKAKGRGRHASKVTEEEEDEEYLKEEEAGASSTRLVTQPSCIQGKMRDYQLAGLNWLIRLYENGINGILADEMVCSTCSPFIIFGCLHSCLKCLYSNNHSAQKDIDVVSLFLCKQSPCRAIFMNLEEFLGLTWLLLLNRPSATL
ncbi:ISWI chromatin-remodeling complex ATPase CHR11-like [Beta vulgaris subsp. vulgaris]|uniref:ISWI chromatin-remodeling complex ATPase CHR11-like n=1 Tax=Beta vulgaris subsp. vulgaris TaxID=3555 RepID=UPI0025469911|nr:ISWI chromatin-remodeling complex ATPase CHR11-like [Beta vulgaris subsp. vulgaris]